MKNWRKKLSYVILGTYFFFEGVEYAVILPTLWMYLENRFNAEQYFLGLVLSSFSLASMIAGPLFGRWSDVKRNPKITIIIGSVFGVVGNFMYFVGISKWFLVISRFVAGVGMGAEPVILAEISRVTSEKERTGILSTMILIRQSGLLFGPGFNVFLRLADFKIGPFDVNKYTDPGAFMACLWFVEVLLLITCYTDLHSIKKIEMDDNSKEMVLLNENFTNENSTGNDSGTGTSENYSADVKRKQSRKHDIISIEKNTDIQLSSTKTEKLTVKFMYKTYIKEEVVTLLAVQFISSFCQVSVETMATPLSAKLLHWGELENSIMFCIAAVEMIVVFVLIKIMSKCLKDRTMILIGSCLLGVANGWLIYYTPRAYNGTPSQNLVGFIVAIFLDVLALPFLLVCSTSLYTKILPKEIQGLSQGLLATTIGFAVILAPLWTGSTLQWPYLMIGVIFGLFSISLLMLLLSFDRLLPPSDTKCVSENSPESDENPSNLVVEENKYELDNDTLRVKNNNTLSNEC